jgi:hypothetical protein
MQLKEDLDPEEARAIVDPALEIPTDRGQVHVDCAAYGFRVAPVRRSSNLGGSQSNRSWAASLRAVTGKPYTLRDRFVHTLPARSTNRPVTWSLR